MSHLGPLCHEASHPTKQYCKRCILWSWYSVLNYEFGPVSTFHCFLTRTHTHTHTHTHCDTHTHSCDILASFTCHTPCSACRFAVAGAVCGGGRLMNFFWIVSRTHTLKSFDISRLARGHNAEVFPFVSPLVWRPNWKELNFGGVLKETKTTSINKLKSRTRLKKWKTETPTVLGDLLQQTEPTSGFQTIPHRV